MRLNTIFSLLYLFPFLAFFKHLFSLFLSLLLNIIYVGYIFCSNKAFSIQILILKHKKKHSLTCAFLGLISLYCFFYYFLNYELFLLDLFD